MKTKFLEKPFAYDGTQLRPLYAYLEHGIQGDSLIAWVGPCDVSFDHMIDGEDLRDESPIRAAGMAHFIAEIFDRDLFAGVALQRLMASIVIDVLSSKGATGFRREGDDVFHGKLKLSISIASRSAVSVQVHFAVNVTNEGTPVPTCSLGDFGIDPAAFAEDVLRRTASEYESILAATRKVRPL